MLVMICGYRRSGKDYTYKLIKNGIRIQSSWNVYIHSRHSSNILSPLSFESTDNIQRLAFADILKEKLALDLNMTVIDMEFTKDIPIPGDINGLTPRHYMIKMGYEYRMKDPLYWVKLVAEKYNPNMTNVVTDFRYPNEIQLGHLTNEIPITIRIVRKSTPMPELEELSEHYMDDYQTDVILTDYDSIDEIINSEHGDSGWTDDLGSYRQWTE